MASGLPKLQRLEVRDSSQLLGVFGQDDDASPVNVEKQMVLPNLSFLKLDNLPSIVCFSPGCDDFLFPRHDLMVDECPKLTTQFANKINVSMSAQSEYLKVAEDSSTGCSEPLKVDKRKKMEVKMAW
ncbi:disease resistance protein [Salix suchowensis]|nr:disease resistance protein [Salix suchowensis]